MDIVYCNLETLFPCVFGSVDTISDNAMKTHPSKGRNHSSLDIEKESDVCGSTFSECQNDDGRKILDKPKIRKKGSTNFHASLYWQHGAAFFSKQDCHIKN